MVDWPMDAFEQPQTEETVTDTATESPFVPRRRAQRLGAPEATPRDDRRGFPTPGGRVADAIEAALFPRLVLVHGGRAAPPALVDAALVGAVDPFTASLTANDEAVSSKALLQHLRGTGATFETICLDVLAPAARKLGAMWETDDCDFALVTLGLSRMQRLMHEMDAQFAAAAVPIDPGRVAILAVTPGEQHVFGIAMIGDFLRRAGWEIHDAVGASSPEIAETIRRTWFAVAALSCSADSGLDGLATRINAIRARSRNRAIGVLVGGLPFIDRPDAAIRVGADAMARDARAAVWQAERLLAHARAREAVSAD